MFWGAAVAGITMFLIGGFDKLLIERPDDATQFGAVTVLWTFLFTLFYSLTWFMVPFMYPTEIFPVSVRAFGNGFGVAGYVSPHDIIH